MANKTIKEKIFDSVKQMIVFTFAIITAFISIQSYLKNSFKDAIKEAITEYVTPIKRDVDDMLPLVKDHERTFELLNYRMQQAEEKLNLEFKPNREAVLPREPNFEKRKQ